MAFYHTYRPQNFNDIKLTQNKVAKILVLSLLKHQLGHAYLFTGTHGTGKTTTARILAKAVNCEKYNSLPKIEEFNKDSAFESALEKFPVPCNECDSCKAITAGAFLDVMEMDAASNRGIDEIRELKEKIRLAPMTGSKKVYIIDEVQMLTTEAFNALLKTLEEPPSHSLFILCTTELHKIPQTIQSRCSRVIFQKPGLEEIGSLLTFIAEKEKINIDGAAVDAIARASGGAFRDAVKLLEMASVQFSPVTVESIEIMTVGSLQINSLNIISQIVSSNIKELLSLVKNCEKNGVNFSELLKLLLSDARDLLFYKVGVLSAAQVNCLSASSTEELQTYSSFLESAFLSEYIDTLSKALVQQKATPIPSLPLELVFLKMCGGVVVERKTVSSVKKSETVTPQSVVVESIESVASEEVLTVPPASAVIPTVTNQDLTIELMLERWPEICKLLKKYHASMSVMMSKCKPLRLDGKSVIIETQNSFNKDMIESAKNRPVIEQAIYELLGAQVRVKTVLANTKLTQKNVENVQPVSDDDLVSVAQEIFGV